MFIISYFIGSSSARELFYAKLYEKSDTKYVYDEWIEKTVGFSSTTDKAKKIWFSQDTNDEYLVKIRCGEGGEHVFTARSDGMIIFSAESKAKDNEQYFTVIKMEEYKEGSKWIYAFKMSGKFLSYNDRNILMQDDNGSYKNQKFEMIHTGGRTDIPPLKFSKEEKKKREEEEKKKREEEEKKKQEEEENNKLEEENKKLEEENRKLEEENKKLENDNESIQNEEFEKPKNKVKPKKHPYKYKQPFDFYKPNLSSHIKFEKQIEELSDSDDQYLQRYLKYYNTQLYRNKMLINNKNMQQNKPRHCQCQHYDPFYTPYTYWPLSYYS
ncbi:hypothetical protein COBT_001253 [Conglomerata obtusa]